MKNLFTNSFLALTFLFVSCNNENNDSTPQLQTEVIEVKLEVPKKGGATEKNVTGTETLDVSFTGTFDEAGELINVEVSQNVLDYFGFESQKDFKEVIENELKKEQVNQITNRPVVYAEAEPDFSTHSGCMKYCNDTFRDENGNKKKGLGGCKFNCWVDTGVRVLEALAKLATKLS